MAATEPEHTLASVEWIRGVLEARANFAWRQMRYHVAIDRLLREGQLSKVEKLHAERILREEG